MPLDVGWPEKRASLLTKGFHELPRNNLHVNDHRMVLLDGHYEDPLEQCKTALVTPYH